MEEIASECKETVFTVKVTEHWNRMPRWVETPFLEMLPLHDSR